MQLAAAAALAATAAVSLAANPVVQTRFTADPAPLVHNDTVFLYAGHDEPDAQGFKMLDWRLYSSKDMVNWTDHGVAASLATFPWARQDNDAWAPQVIERNGRFYLYAPVSVDGNPKTVIGVAVADSPYGPFKDALGKPLIDRGVGYIDPTVFIDDDGQAYLYWGNPDLWYVKLNKDMVSYAGEITKMPSKPQNYQEGPWVYKRNGKYYLAYASTCCPEGLGYAISDKPTGPWVYQGMLMDPNEGSTGNHPGIINYRGQSYLFGFNYRLNFAETPIHRERRSITVDRLQYNPDGTIAKLPWWDNVGVPQVGSLSPYVRVEGETIAWASRVKRPRDRAFEWAAGITTGKSASAGMYVTPTAAPSLVKVVGVDFGGVSPTRFRAHVASETRGGRLEVRLDAADGPLVTALTIEGAGEEQWRIQSTAVSNLTGKHDLYFVFNPSGKFVPFRLDYWQFDQ
jgi:hypothetical protein